jgi:LmbE family N-acetylglucosaminyl deacetylase
MLSRARRLVDAVCASSWSAGFSALRTVGRPVTPWIARGGQSVVVVAPHPDDEVVGCGGALLLHAAAGDRVAVVHVTDGRRSRALPITPQAMAAHRREEARACLAVLGISAWEWLGFREREWDESDLVPRLESVLRELKPDVIYGPSRVDFHPEHAGVAQALALSLPGGAPRAVVRVVQLGVPLTGILANLAADVTDVMPRVIAATAAYRSEEAAVRFSLRARRYAGAASGRGRVAELFWEMPGPAYGVLHSERPTRPLHHIFRGFRRLAVLDPFAYAVGRRERIRLRHRVDALRLDA